MPNHFFQFKQFTVQQEHCAMKVTTDGCLFGAWIADYIASQATPVHKCLDIGTGTGLLSLMVAQKSEATIEAVEIDEAAASQAVANFAASSWKECLHVNHLTIQAYSRTNGSTFDFIFSNPPFFGNDLKSVDSKRNLALHGDSLSLAELLQGIRQLLCSNGKFAVLLPFHRMDYFIQLADMFHLANKVLVRQTERHDYFRCILLFSTLPVQTAQTEITIKQDNEYSAVFRNLLKDYYLYL